MKTFFYTVAGPNCAEDCNFRTCSKRYFWKLQDMSNGETSHLIEGPLSPKLQRVSPFPQLGDVVVLFVQNSSELTTMNRSCECFEGIKKVLVVGDTSDIDGSMYHKLSPRYITQASRAVEELWQVINKMTTPVTSMP